VRFPVEEICFSLLQSVQTAVGPRKGPVGWVASAFSPRSKAAASEDDNSAVSYAEVENDWFCTSTAMYAFMGCARAPSTHAYLPVKMEQSAPKRRHINFRRRGVTQKKHTAPLVVHGCGNFVFQNL
jgi:hypothetical protein